MDEMSRLPKHTNPLLGENSEIKPPIRINAIIIPEGATNGDMIKAMFPNVEVDNAEVELGGKYITLWLNKNKWEDIDYDWWNAPYKGVEE